MMLLAAALGLTPLIAVPARSAPIAGAGGTDGSPGADGTPGDRSGAGIDGGDGSDGGSGGDGDAGIVVGQAVPFEIDDAVTGGNGGKGGSGGHGGAGAAGERGRVGDPVTDGGDGGDGGSGGSAGSGGAGIVLQQAAPLSIQASVTGGAGGAGGAGGSAGDGGYPDIGSGGWGGDAGNGGGGERGGNGGAGVRAQDAATLAIQAGVAGGAGGQGGAGGNGNINLNLSDHGGNGGAGGSGGNGGAGIVVGGSTGGGAGSGAGGIARSVAQQAARLDIRAGVMGGAGGAGGAGGNSGAAIGGIGGIGGNGGLGGDGGAGADLQAASALAFGQGGAVAGGAGGAGGDGGGSATAADIGSGGNGGSGGSGGTGIVVRQGALLSSDGVAATGSAAMMSGAAMTGGAAVLGGAAVTGSVAAMGGAAATGGAAVRGGDGGDGGRGGAASVNDAYYDGYGGDGGNGGSGGGGGNGVLVQSQARLAIDTGVTGGNGGAGGNGARGGDALWYDDQTYIGGLGGVGGNGGNGGDGGAGVVLQPASAVIVGPGATVTGGAGGAGGAAGMGGTGGQADGKAGTGGSAGAGGVGIRGASEGGVVIFNAGTIRGGPGGGGQVGGGRLGAGSGGEGLEQADAIDLYGSHNALVLAAGSNIEGTVAVAPGGTDNVLALGGRRDSTQAFDVAAIGNQYRGFDTYAKIGPGSWTLANATTAVTPWTLAGGVLRIASDASLGDASGALTFRGGTLETTADIASTRAVTLSGNGTIITDAGTTLTLGGAISGDGALTKSGAGKLLLTGDESGFTGDTTVQQGTLSVGVAGGGTRLGGAVRVMDGASLGGAGQVGSVQVGAGAIVAPGNSIGTLRVAGDLVFDPTSRYEVEVDPGGSASDRVEAGGQVVLNGASVSHIGLAGDYKPHSVYTIVSADGGVSGTFGAVSSTYAFLAPSLTYDPTHVYLELERNGVAFRDVAATANQRAAATGIEGLGAGAAVYDAIVTQSGDTASIRRAYDRLSGEIHASVKAALLDESQFARDAVNDRLRAAFGEAGAGSTPVTIYGTGDAPAAAPADADAVAGWARAYGAWGSLDGDAHDGSARLDRSAGGLFIGVDAPLPGRWRAGLLAGYGNSSLTTDARDASAKVDSYTLGAYAGTQAGALGLRVGAAQTWHHVDTRRGVFLPGTARASYHGGTTQVFGEAGYMLHAGPVSVEPYAGLAYANQRMHGYDEGTPAGLHADRDSDDVTFSTLGARVAGQVRLGHAEATLHGALGWRHAYGSVTPTATHAFDGGPDFTVAGTPIARDAALIEAGLDMQAGRWTTVGVAYQGQIGQGTQQHGVMAQVKVAF